jgi:hypothetical protein
MKNSISRIFGKVAKHPPASFKPKIGLDWEKFEELGSFSMQSTAAVGDLNHIIVPVLTGKYRAYFLDSSKYDEYYKEMENKGICFNYLPDQLFIIHKNYLSNPKSLFDCRKFVGEFPIDGARFSIFESASIQNKEFVNDITYDGDHGIFRDKGVIVCLTGDGSGKVYTSSVGDTIVAISIDAI